MRADEILAMIGDGVLKLIEHGLFAAGADRLRAPSLLPNEADPATHTRCYPSVVETLRTLVGYQCRLAVVTNKPVAATLKILRAFSLGDLFDVVIGGDTLPQRTPNPVPLREAARQLAVDPAYVVMVGDNIHHIEAAHAAGTVLIAVTCAYHHLPPSSFGAARPIDRFDELLSLVRDLPAHGDACRSAIRSPTHPVHFPPESLQ